MNKHMELLNLILDRRSCRSFLPQVPDRPALAAIVEAGRYAPSAMNRQQCHFYVVTDPSLLERFTQVVSGNMKGFEGRDCRYGAPALVVVTSQKGYSMALQDASCAMENMMLAACAMGVGSCWVNQPFHLRDNEEMKALLAQLGVGEEEFPCCSLALGLPAGELFPGRPERTGNAVTWVTGE